MNTREHTKRGNPITTQIWSGKDVPRWKKGLLHNLIDQDAKPQKVTLLLNNGMSGEISYTNKRSKIPEIVAPIGSYRPLQGCKVERCVKSAFFITEAGKDKLKRRKRYKEQGVHWLY